MRPTGSKTVMFGHCHSFHFRRVDVKTWPLVADEEGIAELLDDG
jgi:hypothetical protein